MGGETLRAAVVGTGYLGRLHARVLTEIPGVTVVGFVEPRDQTAREVEATLGLTRFAAVSDLAGKIDCAIIATPTTSHFEIASGLIDGGCDVMIEKPITVETADAEALIRLAGEKGRLIQVGHVERYNPAIQAVSSLLDSPRFVEAQRLGVFAARSLDIDVLLDLMIHDLNLVLSLLGKRVERVDAVGVPVLTDKVDIANVRLLLENGAVANLTASRVSSERVRKVRFFGGDSYISVDTKEQDVKGYRLVAGANGRSIQPIGIEVEKKEPLRAELESFLARVRDRGRPLVNGEDGLEALRLAIRVGEAINESMSAFRES